MKQVLNFDGQVYWSTNKERGVLWSGQTIKSSMRTLKEVLQWSLVGTGIGLFIWLVVLNHAAQVLGICLEWLKRF